MMMDDSAPTHKKKKLVKTYKNVLSKKKNGLWLLKYAGDLLLQKSDKME